MFEETEWDPDCFGFTCRARFAYHWAVFVSKGVIMDITVLSLFGLVVAIGALVIVKLDEWRHRQKGTPDPSRH